MGAVSVLCWKDEMSLKGLRWSATEPCAGARIVSVPLEEGLRSSAASFVALEETTSSLCW
jgi:hypothetical protein